MKKSLRNLLLGIGMSVALSGCPTPTPTPDYWADITYVVEGKDGTNQASNITYGRIDEDGNWVDDFYTMTGSVTLPKSYTTTTCTGHKVRLGASASGKLILKIKDDGKVVVEDDDVFILGKIEYYIPSR